MIVKFFANKGGGSAGASLDYLLGKDREREGAKVLKGDPELSLAIAETLTFKNNYTVGCLSFAEAELSTKQKIEIMEKFEKTLFAGLKEDQYNITWIEHNDKGRVELNFFIPNVEMTTQKRLQPYYDKADRPLVDTFKKVINHDYQLISPDEKDREQLYKANELRQPKSTKFIKEDLGSQFAEMIAQGYITDRKQIIDVLTKSGYEISRTTEKSISIKNPDGGRNIRLDGAIYGTEYYKEITTLIERTETTLGRHETTKTASEQETQGVRNAGATEDTREIEAIRERYNQAVKYRQESNANNFKKSKNIDRLASDSGSSVIGFNHNGISTGRKTQRKISRNSKIGRDSENNADRVESIANGELEASGGRQIAHTRNRNPSSEPRNIREQEPIQSDSDTQKIRVHKFHELPGNIQKSIRDQDAKLAFDNNEMGINSLIWREKYTNKYLFNLAEQPTIKEIYDEFSKRIAESIDRATQTLRKFAGFTKSISNASEAVLRRSNEMDELSNEATGTDKAIAYTQYRINRAIKYFGEPNHTIKKTIEKLEVVPDEIKLDSDKTHESAPNLNDNNFEPQPLARTSNIAPKKAIEAIKEIDDDFDR